MLEKKNNSYGLGQLDWTINEIVKKFPEFGVYQNGGNFNNPNPLYSRLYNLFHDTLSDNEISKFRWWWHQWTVKKNESCKKEIEQFLENIINSKNNDIISQQPSPQRVNG
jgi:hypothetical protein